MWPSNIFKLKIKRKKNGLLVDIKADRVRGKNVH